MKKDTLDKLAEYAQREGIDPELKALLQEASGVIESEELSKIDNFRAVFPSHPLDEECDRLVTSINNMDVEQSLEFIKDKRYEIGEIQIGIGDEEGGYWLVSLNEVSLCLNDKDGNELVRL